jgi:hypothetical protein
MPDGSPPQAGDPVPVVLETRVITESSLWVLRPGFYLRLPLIEAPRPPSPSPRLEDGRWLGHRGVIWLHDDSGWGINIFPVDGPANGGGLISGVVRSVLYR